MTDLLLNDPTIWVLFSFALFVVVAFIFGRQTILSGLDRKIEAIREEIGAAETLRAEAAALLAEYQRQAGAAAGAALRIVEEAEKQALAIQKQAEEEFEETLSRRETLLKERLSRMEEAARDDLRRYAADLAVSATSEIIAARMTEERAKDLTDSSIRAISDRLN